MPFLTGDIMKAEVKQEYYEQSMLNTLFWRIVEVTAGVIAQSILDALSKFVVDQMAIMQSNNLQHVEQVYDNLTDQVSQLVTTYSITGQAGTTESLASFYAIGMKKVVASRITRPGSIRISGVLETSVDGNSLTAGAVITADAIGVQLAAVTIIDDGAGNIAVFQPVVVGRGLLGVFDLTRINDISAITFPRPTTQNSRKPGR